MVHLLGPGALVAAVSFALAACGVETAGGGVSGVIEGRVSLGPIMPVCQVGVPCDGVYADARIAVRNKAGSSVATAVADQQGMFRVEVAAGAYVVEVEVSGPLPNCPRVDVVVTAGTKVRADIACDTGIR